MPYRGTVYELNATYKEGQPSIDLQKHGYWEEWKELDQSFPENVDTLACRQLSFEVDHPLATNWDWYFIDYIGAFSFRACDVLWAHLRNCCNRFVTTINGEPYYIMRSNGQLVDCVNRDESILKPFPTNPNLFLEVKRLRFHRELLQDPLVFMVPEYINALLVTESIKDLVKKSKLVGFGFMDCESISDYGFME